MATSTGEKPAESLFAGLTFARIETTTPTTAGTVTINMSSTYGLPNDRKYIIIGAARRNINGFWYSYNNVSIAAVELRYVMQQSELANWGGQRMIVFVAYFN